MKLKRINQKQKNKNHKKRKIFLSKKLKEKKYKVNQ